MSRARRVLWRVVLVVLALPAALLAVEAIALLFDPFGASDSLAAERYRAELVEFLPGNARIFRHRPNRTLKFRGWSARTNGDGLRGPDLAIPKPAGVKRLVFVGDSVVFGWGVNEEATFVSLVERDLQGRGSWEAVNLGHLFHDTTQEWAAFEEVGLRYEPDLVLLLFVDNDVVLTREVLALETSGLSGAPNEQARRVGRTVERLAKLKPFLPHAHALLQFLYYRASPAAQTGSVEQAGAVGIDVEKGWREAQGALREFRDLSRSGGARFAVLDLYRFGRLEEFCVAERIPYASIELTAQEKATGVRNSAADAHANPNGHRIYARHILDAIARLGLVE